MSPMMMSYGVSRRGILPAPDPGPPASDLLHFFRPTSGLNYELPRGETANNDVMFSEARQVMASRGGAGYDLLWNWSSQRKGGTRELAIPSEKRLTVTNWSQFMDAAATAAAGAGDYEILIPAELAMSDTYDIPAVTGDRRLYITYSGSLPTADVMPSLATLDGCAQLIGPGFSRGYLLGMNAGNNFKTTWTGVVLRPQATIGFGCITMSNDGTVTDASQIPSGHIFDRWALNCDDYTGSIRSGVIINGSNMAFLEGYVTNVRDNVGAECSGFRGWKGSRRILRRNTYVEAQGIGILYGGADPYLTNTGLQDPADSLDINVCVARRSGWMTENSGGPLLHCKTTYETKNKSRWFMWNCVQFRAPATGQARCQNWQSLQDEGDNNANFCINQDILQHNMLFRDVQNGPVMVSRVAFSGATLPVNPSARLGVVNARLENLGENFGSFATYSGSLYQLFGDLQGAEFDQISYTSNAAASRANQCADAPPTANNIRVTNLAGQNMGFFMGGSDVHPGYLGDAAWANFVASGQQFAGNVVFGDVSSDYTASQVMTGQTNYTDAAAMGFNTTTGVVSAPGSTQGVSGGMPGTNHAQLDAGIASMASWAFSR